jgi:anti-sigma regulatory factor (Ser/Thr protein kinase)
MTTTIPLWMHLPADPALAVSVRVFVAASARLFAIRDADVEDLRLAATELLANAVEHGADRLELALTSTDGTWVLAARGAGSFDEAAGDPLVRRLDILRGIASVRLDGDRIECSGPLDPALPG